MNAPENLESAASTLCKSCGLCCTGHLFAWVKLRSPELGPIEDLGVPVVREPQHRGFSQPCPLWHGQCTIYDSPHYPHFCHLYKCQLLKKLIDETTLLSDALTVIEHAKEMIYEVESLLPDSINPNFRERLVAHIESGNATPAFVSRAEILLRFYKDHFGVKDMLLDFGDP